MFWKWCLVDITAAAGDLPQMPVIQPRLQMSYTEINFIKMMSCWIHSRCPWFAADAGDWPWLQMNCTAINFIKMMSCWIHCCYQWSAADGGDLLWLQMTYSEINFMKMMSCWMHCRHCRWFATDSDLDKSVPKLQPYCCKFAFFILRY